MATLADITPHQLKMFWSPACGPSLHMTGLILDLADDLVGIMEVNPIKVEDDPTEAIACNVKFTPTFVVIVDGVVKGTLAGTATEEEFVDWLAGRLLKVPEKKPKKPRKVKDDAQA